MPKTIYLTTPLYYVNAAPHIGHSYTTVAADCLARYHRSRGQDVFLLTGTDEHGQKIEQAAAAAGQTPQAFADEMVGHFTKLWTTLNISHNDFIRTTQARHVQAVQAILAKLHEAGKLKRASYQGWYCTPDETFWTEGELSEGAARAPVPLCPACQRPLESAKEEGWYLELETERAWLTQFVRSHPQFIRPQTRYNELVSLLAQPLPEYLCITRPRSRVSWGIEVPFSPGHVVYVWFDALLNYITVPGYGSERFDRLWPADAHLIGKDILRHHAVYWPIMLHALGFPDERMPRMIFAHGWWKIGEQKMSKSLGNIVNPAVVIEHVLAGQPYAADVYRYFLLREVPFGQDGSFSEEAILARLASDLANDLGNLVNRTLSMIARYASGRIPALGSVGCAVEDEPLRQAAVGVSAKISEAMEQVEFSAALTAIMEVVGRANRYIEAVAPWHLAKRGQSQRLGAVLRVLAEVIRIVAITVDPFMPSVAHAMWQQLGQGTAPRRLQDATRWPGIADGQTIGAHPILFPRSDRTPPA